MKLVWGMTIALLPSLAWADATLPREAWKPQQCVDHTVPERRAPPPPPVVTVATDEEVGHVVPSPVRRETVRRPEAPLLQSLAPVPAALPAQTAKREARTDGGPLDFVDDVIDSGDLVSRVAAPPPIKLAPAPRLPKARAPQSK